MEVDKSSINNLDDLIKRLEAQQSVDRDDIVKLDLHNKSNEEQIEFYIKMFNLILNRNTHAIKAMCLINNNYKYYYDDNQTNDPINKTDDYLEYPGWSGLYCRNDRLRAGGLQR